MALKGKGWFIWQVRNTEGGDPNAIANEAVKAGLSHVAIKVADAGVAVNLDPVTKADLLPPIVAALKSRGIQVWGWHYVYGYDPVSEGRMGAQRVQQLGLDGYAIDCEVEYKEPGKDVAARRYLDELKSRIPSTPIALCSFRFPSYHPQLPWSVFLERCDLNMPQVYWEKAHNAGAQLTRCVQEFQALKPVRPVFPVGSAYYNAGWSPTESDELEFLQTAKSLGLSGASFYSWDDARRNLQPLWSVISNYSWPGGQPPPVNEIVNQLISALNSHDINTIMSLYRPDAVQITAGRTIVGSTAIANWYTTLFSQTLPEATFTLAAQPVTGDGTRQFSWTAISSKGKVRDGSDTLGLIDGKISYHYTYFTVTA
jgi:ketosteroid isomerase-like protein